MAAPTGRSLVNTFKSEILSRSRLRIGTRVADRPGKTVFGRKSGRKIRWMFRRHDVREVVAAPRSATIIDCKGARPDRASSCRQHAVDFGLPTATKLSDVCQHC